MKRRLFTREDVGCLFDLLALPPGWEQVVVKRGATEGYTVKVLY